MPFVTTNYRGKPAVFWRTVETWESSEQTAWLQLEGQPRITLLAPRDPTQRSSDFNPIRIDPACNNKLNDGKTIAAVFRAIRYLYLSADNWPLPPEALQLNLDYDPANGNWSPRVWINAPGCIGYRFSLAGSVLATGITEEVHSPALV